MRNEGKKGGRTERRHGGEKNGRTCRMKGGRGREGVTGRTGLRKEAKGHDKKQKTRRGPSWKKSCGGGRRKQQEAIQVENANGVPLERKLQRRGAEKSIGKL